MKRNCRFFILICLICSVFLSSGCETLRKKFTRKKKAVQSTEPMVIVPRDYSAHPFPSDVLYKQYFSYWKSWNQELIESIAGSATYKKILECSEQTVTNLLKMESYLKEEQATALHVYVQKAQDLKGRIEHARNLPSSQMNMLKYDAERILSNVNRKFDATKMKEFFK